MVYIKSDTVRIGDKSYKLVIRYLARRKRFVTTLPDVMQKVLGYKEIEAETQEQLENKWHPTIKKYTEAITAEEKVIVYKFKCNAIIWNEDNTRVIFRQEDIFKAGTALDLSWYVGFRQVREGEDPHFYYQNRNLAHVDRWKEKVKYMAWTEDRERFFKALQKGLDTMILNSYRFFNETDDIHKLIDAGTINLLPAPGEEE